MANRPDVEGASSANRPLRPTSVDARAVGPTPPPADASIAHEVRDREAVASRRELESHALRWSSTSR